MSEQMPNLLRNRLEDARDTATSNIEWLSNENKKDEEKIERLRTQIADRESEIADNEAAYTEANRLLAGTPSEEVKE